MQVLAGIFVLLVGSISMARIQSVLGTECVRYLHLTSDIPTREQMDDWLPENEHSKMKSGFALVPECKPGEGQWRVNSGRSKSRS